MVAAWSQSRFVRSLGDWSSRDDGAMFHALAEQIRARIRTGQIPAGARLPSERALAASIGVSRSTVIAAFDELRSAGLVARRQGSGTHVTVAGMHRSARGEGRLQTFLGEGGGRVDLRSAALPGLPLVAEEIARLSPELVLGLLDSHGYLLQGLPRLREAIATYYADLGLPTDAERVLVTSGAQQALRLVASTMLEPRSVVVVENPTFRGAIETLKSIGLTIIAVPSGPRGIDLTALQATLATHRVQMVFVQSSGHNPTGSVMDAIDRRRLADLASAHDALLVEDAAVLDATFDAPLVAPVSAPGRVVTIGSASKSFWGGLRVGWLRAGPELIEHLTLAKGSEDLGTSLLTQMLAANLLPRIDEAREQRRASLSAGRDALLTATSEHLPDWEIITPRAGASAWARIPRTDAVAFTQYAARHDVLLLPGSTFSVDDDYGDHVRLAFAAPPEVVKAGITQVGRVWDAYVRDVRAPA